MRAAVLLVLVVGCGGSDAAVDAGIPNDAGTDMRHVLAQTVNDMTVDLAVADMAMPPDMTQPPDLGPTFQWSCIGQSCGVYRPECDNSNGELGCAYNTTIGGYALCVLVGNPCRNGDDCCYAPNGYTCMNQRCCAYGGGTCSQDSDCCGGAPGSCLGTGNCCRGNGGTCYPAAAIKGCCAGLTCDPTTSTCK